VPIQVDGEWMAADFSESGLLTRLGRRDESDEHEPVQHKCTGSRQFRIGEEIVCWNLF